MIEKFVPDYIKKLTPYPPGKPIEELEREYGISDSIKLASNENPIGPSPKAMEAIGKKISSIHRYPDGGCFYLKEKLSKYHGLSPDHFIIGNGSNEIIEFLIKTLIRVGDEVVMGDPSFIIYRMINQTIGGKNVIVPLKDWRFDLDEMKANITEKTRLIFIDNPNNPVGINVKDADFASFMDGIDSNVVVVLDEAYKEFVTDKENADFSKYMNGKIPIISLRTFSKIYGLSGLRIGYGIARPEIISILDKVRQPFNVNSLAQAAAEAAIGDEEFVKRTLEVTREGFDYLYDEFSKIGIEAVESHTNFILVDVGKPAVEIYEKLLREGVIVRSMAGYGLKTHIRVTSGLPKENKRFISALKKVI